MQRNIVHSGHRLFAITELLGDVLQPNLCHRGHGSLRPMDSEDLVVTPEETTEEQPAPTALDLDAIQRDLADVEVALARLDAGTYWTDEVTGDPLPAELLEQHPTARRA